MLDEKKIYDTLNIDEPWSIEKMIYDDEKQRLDVFVNLKLNARLQKNQKIKRNFCPLKFIGEYKVYDTQHTTWKYVGLFDYECYLHCKTPKIMFAAAS